MAKAKKKTAKKAAPAKQKTAAKKPAPKAKKPAPKKATKKPAPKKAAAKKPAKIAEDSTESLFADLADEIDAVVDAVPTPAKVAVDTSAQNAVHTELGAKLASARGDEAQERAAFASAIDAFMRIQIDRGAPAQTSPSEYQCAEFFWEGDTANPPVYGRVPDATHDEIGRWFKLLVEETRAYEARVTATA